MKNKITEKDYLKASRRAARQAEIEEHGHPPRRCTVAHRSKKTYSRKMVRAGLKGLPESFYRIIVKYGIISSGTANKYSPMTAMTIIPRNL